MCTCNNLRGLGEIGEPPPLLQGLACGKPHGRGLELRVCCLSEGVSVYELSAVLIHRGVSAYSGHYIAHVKDPQTGDWYRFNDEDIEKMEGKKLQLGAEEDLGNAFHLCVVFAPALLQRRLRVFRCTWEPNYLRCLSTCQSSFLCNLPNLKALLEEVAPSLWVLAARCRLSVSGIFLFFLSPCSTQQGGRLP